MLQEGTVPGTGPLPLLDRPFLKAARRNRTILIGCAIILVYILLGLLAPLIAPYSPTAQHLPEGRLLKPSWEHWCGTDDLGRDVLSRLRYGTRISLPVSFLSVALALLAGGLIGVVAGYYGGRLDNVLMRLLDVLLAFPSILLAILIVAVLGPNLMNAMLAIGIVNIPGYARLARATALTLKHQEYIEAAVACGSTPSTIIARHIVPNSLSPLVVQGTLGLGGAILEIAGLSFLGLGAQPPAPEWGSMLSNAQQYMQT
ncbi:MAG: ABC transporter permease, partial [Nevskia sp.]|nr:ABC transporter permease [Nevskia sp.]